MSKSSFADSLPYPDEMPTTFNGNPEVALNYARARQLDRYKLAAFRASLAFFDAWTPKSAALPWVERLLGYLPMIETKGARGPAPAPQPLLDMKSLGEAVNATCLTSAGFHKLADKVVSRTGRCFKPSLDVQGVLETRHALIAVNLFRFAEAQTHAENGVQAFAQDTGAMKPFGCRGKALLARGYVLGSRYLFDRTATDGLQLLYRVVADAKTVLSSQDQTLANKAVQMLVSASACMCFAGLGPLDCPDVPKLKGRLQNAKARWSRALLACANTRYLSEDSENQFRSAREDFMGLELSLDVIHITLDLQFWLIVSKRLRDAAAESHLLRSFLPSIGNEDQEEAVTLWLAEVDNLMLTYSTTERVLSEVRQVGKPKNLRSLIGR